ncbi:MAG: hypothetical protein IKM88_16455 [Lachnospiraceae bacterium]|nr:hypothetical protein [Lachnospiraceae bacterium]
MKTGLNMISKRLINTILVAIVAFLCLSFLIGCTPKEGTEFDINNRETKAYSDEELKEFMQYYISEKKAHPGDEKHWSRKIMFIGLNEREHCLDITVIDCDEKIMKEVIANLKDYPANIHITDHYIVEAGYETREEHIYKRHDDGTIDEYHYRARENDA